MTCSIDNCNKNKYSRGWCKMHYERQRRYDSLEPRSHGMCKTGEYHSWRDAKARVFNPNSLGYKDYGGRGITMCDRWANSFEQFYKDMGPRPRSMSIDRIDNDGNYEPTNCRWATQTQQNINRRQPKISPTGVIGVYKDERYEKPYKVQFKREGKLRYLGNFSTLKEATQIRKQAELAYGA